MAFSVFPLSALLGRLHRFLPSNGSISRDFYSLPVAKNLKKVIYVYCRINVILNAFLRGKTQNEALINLLFTLMISLFSFTIGTGIAREVHALPI